MGEEIALEGGRFGGFAALLGRIDLVLVGRRGSGGVLLEEFGRRGSGVFCGVGGGGDPVDCVWLLACDCWFEDDPKGVGDRDYDRGVAIY